MSENSCPIKTGWGNRADIRLCTDHESALGLLVDDEKDRLVEGMSGEAAAITPCHDSYLGFLT